MSTSASSSRKRSRKADQILEPRPGTIQEITALTPVEPTGRRPRSHIEFRQRSSHRSNYVMLEGRVVSQSKWVSPEIHQIHIFEPVSRMFHALGMGYLMSTHENSYFRLTLEFLSSFEKHFPDNGSSEGCYVEFRLMNREYRLTLAQLSEIFGVPMQSRTKFPQTSKETRQHLWSLFGTGTYDVHRTKASQIRHPAIRYFQQWMARTIFGRHNSGGVTVNELILIYLSLEDVLGYHHLPLASFREISIAALIATQLSRAVQTNTSKNTGIALGGVVTMIARRLGINVGMFPDHEIAEGSHFLDLTQLRARYYYRRAGRDDIWRYMDTGGTTREIILTAELVSLDSADDIYFDPPPELHYSATAPRRMTSQSQQWRPEMPQHSEDAPDMGYRVIAPFQPTDPFQQFMVDSFHNLRLENAYTMEVMHRLDADASSQWCAPTVPLPHGYSAPWYTPPDDDAYEDYGDEEDAEDDEDA